MRIACRRRHVKPRSFGNVPAGNSRAALVRRAASCIAAALLLHAAPALACRDGEYSLTSYTKGDTYEIDKPAVELKKETGTSVPGGCVDCNDRGPYTERKSDLDAKKKRLRELRKNAEDEGKARLQQKLKEARAEYNAKAKQLREIDARIDEVIRQLREATSKAQKEALQQRKEALDDARKNVADQLKNAKAKLDEARKDLDKFQAMIEAIKKEMADLQRQTSELNGARNSCAKPCPPNPPGTIGQCR